MHVAFSVISTFALFRASNFLDTTVYEICPFNEESESNLKCLNITNHYDISTDW